MDPKFLPVAVLIAVILLAAGAVIGNVLGKQSALLKRGKGRRLYEAEERMTSAVGLFGNYVASVTNPMAASLKLDPDEAAARVDTLLKALEKANVLLSGRPYNAPAVCFHALAQTRKTKSLVQRGNLQPSDLAHLWSTQVEAYIVTRTMLKILVDRHVSPNDEED